MTGVARADAGMANETIMVELGPGHTGMVLRLPPLEPTFPDLDLSVQAAVQNAVASAGIPAPAPTVFVGDSAWIGTPFLVMPRVTGFIPGPAPLLDRAIGEASPERQRMLHDGLIDTLVDLHAVNWDAAGLGTVLPGPTVAAALDHWATYVEWAGAGAPLPVLTDALHWCRGRLPEDGRARERGVLLWGDARLGNLVFDDDGAVHAVLDWDLAAVGPPEMDLGWHFGLDYMMEQLFGQRVPGFPERTEAVDRYQARSGHVVADLEWHEVFALIRALAINDRHQRIAGSDRRAENPMIAVLAARIGAVR